MKIAAIYQGDGSTIDNLTIITDDRDVMTGRVAYLGTDEHGGTAFSQWGEMSERDICDLSKDGTRLIFRKRTHIGKLIRFEDLTADTQKHIAQRVLL